MNGDRGEHMQHTEIYMSLEVSEYSIKSVIAEYNNQQIHVLSSKERIFNLDFEKENAIDDMKNIIVELKDEMIAQLGFQIRNVILIIPSSLSKKFSDKIKVEAISFDNVISKDEIASGIDALIKKNDNNVDFVANVIIDRYSAYGYGYVSNPVGLETRYIELEASVYTVPTTIAYPLIKLIEDCGFNVVEVCLDVVAIATEALQPAALKTGAIIVDMGYDNTNVAYFKNSTLQSYSNIELGGKHITNDIELIAKMGLEKAELFKKKYVDLAFKDNNDLVIYKYLNEVENEKVEITQSFISEVAKSRQEEIINLISKEIANFKVEDGEVVYFSGGANNINGLDQLVKTIFKYPFQIVSPKILGARNSSFIKCLGAIRQVALFSRVRGEIKLFVNKKEYLEAINLVEKNNLLYNNSKSENDFIKHLVSYIFNN